MEENHHTASRPGSSPAVRLCKAVALLVLGIIFLAGGLLAYARFAMEGEDLARLVVPRLERELRQTIRYSSVTIEWPANDRFRLSITGLTCTPHGSRTPLLAVPDFACEVNLSQLASRTLLVEHIRIQRPVVAVAALAPAQRDALAARMQLLSQHNPPVQPLIKRIEIRGAKVILPGCPDGDGPRSVALQNITVLATNVQPGRAERVSVGGDIAGGRNAGAFSLSGRIGGPATDRSGKGSSLSVELKRLPLYVIRAAACRRGRDIPVKGGAVDARVTLRGGPADWEFAGEAGLSDITLLPGDLFYRKAILKVAGLDFQGTLSGSFLTLHLTKVLLPGLSLSARVTSEDIFAKDPELDVSVGPAQLDLHRVFPLLPLNLLEEGDRKSLLEAGLKGQIRISEGSWKGHPRDPARVGAGPFRLRVSAELDRVAGYVPWVGSRLENASGRVKVGPDEIVFDNIHLTLGKSPVEVNGTLTRLQSAPQVDLFVDLNARGAEIEPVLETRLLKDRLPGWLAALKTPRGHVAVSLDLKGTLARPAVRGRVDLNDFHCQIKGLKVPLKNATGSIRFREQGISIEEVSCMLGNSRARMDGVVASNHVDLAAHIQMSPRDMGRVFKLRAERITSRPAPVTVELGGKPRAVTFAVSADFTDQPLVVGSYIKKAAGVPLVLEASGVRQDRTTRIDTAYVHLESGRIAVQAKVDDTGAAVLYVNLPPRGIQTQHLVPYAHPGLELRPGGRIEGDGVFKFSHGLARSPYISLDLILSHVSGRFFGFHKPVSGLTGSIKWKGRSFEGIIRRARIGNTAFSGKCAIMMYARPEVDATLKIDFFDSRDFAAPPEYVSRLTWGEWLRRNYAIRFLARCRGQARITAEKGQYSLRPFSDFRGNIVGNGGVLNLADCSYRMAEGLVQMDARFDFREGSHKPLSISFRGERMAMSRILLSDPRQVSVDGKVHLTGNLMWELTKSRENDGIYQTGEVDVRVRDGTIHRFEILSKIFSLVNLGSLLRGRLPDVIGEGLPYQHMTWQMKILDTKWQFKDFVLTSDAATIEASGMYFSEQGRIDFLVSVSPLVGLDTIVSGVFNSLFARNARLLTTTFRVRGLYGSPDVRLEPLDQFR